MKNSPRFTYFWRWLIRFVGLIVPARLRADWRQEWEAELQYRERLLAEWDKLHWQSKLDLWRRSFGALWDALLLQPRRMEDEMFQDLRFGVRMLLKSKRFTAVAVLSLALGIGANTAIFSIINALMLRALPVNHPQELVVFSIVGTNVTAGARSLGFNPPLFEKFRDRSTTLAGVCTGNNVNPTRLLVKEPGASAETVQQQNVSGNFFTVLGVNAVIGRTLTDADDQPGNTEPAAVISYAYWQRRFGLDPHIVGRQVIVNNKILTIVGVAPPGFFGFDVGRKPELWWTLNAENGRFLKEPEGWWIRVLGRVRPGVSVAQAQAEMDVIFRQHNEEVAAARSTNWTPARLKEHLERNIRLLPGGAGVSSLRQQFQQPLFLLMATVGLVLLIACVNLANLLLARAVARRKELVVRSALGAGRFRLIRQLLTESVLLSLLGGAAGLLFARVCSRVLLTYLPLPYRDTLDVPLDARVLGFTLAVSLLTGLVFGLAPAFHTTRLNLTNALNDQASARMSRMRLNHVLMVAQVALSLYLLIGAGLFVRSLRNLQTVDTGFNYDNIVQFSLDAEGGYDSTRRSQLYQQLLTRLEALPGVHSATLLKFSLLGNLTYSLKVSAPGAMSQPAEQVDCNVLEVGPRFFEMMQMPILAGRAFTAQDERPLASPDNSPPPAVTPSPRLAVINQAMSRALFNNENPVGKHFVESGEEIEIIGVVRDAKYATLREHPPRTYYLYYFQQPYRGNMKLQLRTMGDAAAVASAIRNLVRELDQQLRVVELQTMSDIADELLVQERFLARTASAFGLFALLLACVGLYGVMSYAVTRRTNEIGIRMALGAQPRNVVWLVMREILITIGLGIGLGMTAALLTTHYVAALLFDLTPNDPLTIVFALLLMASVAALAGYWPARKAAQVDPLIALRHE